MTLQSKCHTTSDKDQLRTKNANRFLITEKQKFKEITFDIRIRLRKKNFKYYTNIYTIQ